MLNQLSIKHAIGKGIASYLTAHEYARFSDMRPKNVDTNLFSYHLKLLVRQGFVKKTDYGYALDQKGLLYVDRVSGGAAELRTQPKTITMLLIQDGYGNVLLQKRTNQPYINTWTLPYGKPHISDGTVLDAAVRWSREKLNYTPKQIRHVGDCYIITHTPYNSEPENSVQTRTHAHITRFETDDIKISSGLRWIEPLALPTLTLAPAIEQIVARAFFNDQFFFEEFNISLQ